MDPTTQRPTNPSSPLQPSPALHSNDGITSKTASIFTTYHLSSAQATPNTRRDYIQKETYASDFSKLVNSFAGHGVSAPEAELITLEIIAKVLTYDQLTNNQKITLPTRMLSNANIIELKPFIVKVIELADGNMAYLFEPAISEGEGADYSPILSFRGTSAKHAPGSLKADLGFKAVKPAIFSTEMFPSPQVGRSVYKDNESQAKINSILTATYKKYGKVIFTGHSLGGKLASSFALESGNYTNIKKLIVFNAPGISIEQQRFYKSLGSSSFPALSITTKGDVIGNSIAMRRFFNKKIVLTPTGIKLDPFKAHQICVVAGNLIGASVTTSNALKPRKILKAVRIVLYITLIGVAAAAIYRLGLILIAASVEHKFNKFKKNVEYQRAFGIILKPKS
jgi:hypothetical protein